MLLHRKKILMSLTYYAPNISGLTRYAKILAEELAVNNDVQVVTSRHIKDLAQDETIKKVRVKRIDGLKIGKGFYMPFFVLKTIKLVKTCDTLLLHVPSIENVFLSVAGKILGKNIITVYHCKFKSGNKLVDMVLKNWQNIGITFSNAVVVNSIDYLDGYKLLRKYRKKVVEILPPINVNRSREKYSFGNKKVIGYLGRISKEKNLEILIKAAKKLGGDYLLVLAGPNKTVGEDVYINKIINMAKNTGNVIMIGEIEKPEKFYNSIDCLVLPSNNELESFGMVSAEAIKCGCPVVTTNRPGIRQPVLLSGYGEVFEDNKLDDLVKKIITVTAKKMKNKQNNKIFDIKEFFEKYKKII